MNRFVNRFWLSLAVVAVAFLFLTGRIASGQVTGDRETMIFNGSMACYADGDENICPAGIHYVDLRAGRAYMIRMDSADFDTSLIVENVFGRMMGNDIEYFDRLWGEVVFYPTETGRYRLIANSFNGVGGDYTISVRELPILFAVNESLSVEDTLVNNCYERTYDVPLVAGRRYVIDMDSLEFDTFVKLLNVDGSIVAFEDECGMMRNSRIVFTPTVSATYRIVATSNADRSIGAFRLMVCED